ncbi:MAG: neutral/alkaline non-lysosomal ceramidase N-terminal domain-containing protein [Planctomycetota bacterium]
MTQRLTCLLLLSLIPSTATAAEEFWKAGAASVRITPETPVWMAGYASRTGPSEGVLLDLQASAVVLTDANHRRLAIVSMDLIEIPVELRQQLLTSALRSHGLQPSELLLNVSHTHGGPMVSAKTVADWGADPVWGDRTDAWLAKLVLRVDHLLGQAIAAQQPARIRFARSTSPLAMNRRLPTPEGVRLAPNPAGPVDHDVPVLQISSTDDRLLAVVFGYACHSTTLGGIPLLNGDYVGYARQQLEQKHPTAVAVFLGGCGGDQDPVLRGGPMEAQQNGHLLATAVEQALQQSSQVLLPKLAAAMETVPLPFAPLPPRSELEARAASPNGFVARHAKMILQNWPGPKDEPPDYQYPIQVFRFGDHLTLVALAGEPMVDYSLQLKQRLGNDRRPVWIAGYSNLVNAYIPTRRTLQEGGYEGTEAIIYQSLPAPFRPEVEDRIEASVQRLATAAGASVSSDAP